MRINLTRVILFAIVVLTIASCSKSSSGPSVTAPTQLDTLYSWTKGNQVAADVEDVWFNDGQHGYITSNTDILSSSDGGVSWATVPNTNGYKVFNLQFVDALHGFAQGTANLGKTNDGGKTWTFKLLASMAGYTSQFLTPSLGFYSDYNKGIYKTLDSGSTWKLILDGSGAGPNFIFDFVDSLHGFNMVNDNFSNTVDGGFSWHLVASAITASTFTTYYKMHFTDTLNGYCGSPLGLFKTADGGKTWKNVLAKQTTFMVPWFFDTANGYCIAANILYKTTNGGDSWAVSCKLGTDDFSGMHFLDMNTGWASTFGGYVLRLKP